MIVLPGVIGYFFTMGTGAGESVGVGRGVGVGVGAGRDEVGAGVPAASLFCNEHPLSAVTAVAASPARNTRRSIVTRLSRPMALFGRMRR